MRRYDLNIVLISAATVLLATTNCCSAAYMVPQQLLHGSTFLNYKTAHRIIRKNSFSRSSSSSLPSSSTAKTSSFANFELHSTPRRNTSNQESWSKRATVSSSTSTDTDIAGTENGKRSESRYGVRRRVRSVLEKAKSRTGIRNNSEDFLGSPTIAPPRTSSQPLKTRTTVSNVVAEAASIGGLGAVVVDEESGEIDVALDYVPLKEKEDTNNDNNPMAERNEKSMESSPSLNTKSTASSSKSSDSTTIKKVKTSPASTYSPSIIRPKPRPEDALIPAKSSKPGSKTSSRPIRVPEMDALKGDVSAAFSVPPPPLPFTLPKLDAEQNDILLSGERVQFQSDMGREGSGFVAVDVKAPASVIWECLLDFYSYPETIPTVRDIQMFTNTHLAQDYYAETAVERKKYEDGTLATLKHGVPSVTRAAFTLSKFRLKIAAIHKYRIHPQGDYMIFTLDPACTNVVLRNAKGVWHTQSNPDGRGEVSFHIFFKTYSLISLIIVKKLTYNPTLLFL